MDHNTTPAAASRYHVLRVSPALGARVREHVRAIKATGGIEAITHFVTTAIEEKLARASRGQS